MITESLDQYVERPREMTNYLSNYGWHFNKKMLNFALSHLPREVSYMDKDKIDSLLKTYNISLPKDSLYDYVYVANYCLSVYYRSAITDEKQLALYVKDTMESEEGVIFTKWYSTMCRLGIPIEWEDMI